MRCGILGGLFLLGTAVGDGGEVVRVAVCWFCAPRISGIISDRSNLYVRGDRMRILNFVSGTLNCTYVCRWRPVKKMSCMLVLPPRT